MLGACPDGLNSAVYRVERRREIAFSDIASAVACYTVVMILALVVSLGILVFGYGIENYLLEKFPFLMKYQDSMVVLPTGLALVILALLFAVLYNVSPKPEDGVSIRQLPGAVPHLGRMGGGFPMWLLCIYLEYASNMSVLYGSLHCDACGCGCCGCIFVCTCWFIGAAGKSPTNI
ncbi:MAG: hypothetical protein ACLTSZ_04560 [Lachnospiraceae bacterium]